MTENEFILQDRLAKIRATNEIYDLLNKSYISFSGGKDSLATSILLDIALPKNNIPRVYIDTGIEYPQMKQFVKNCAVADNRIIIYHSNINIGKMLKENGYPFKSKQHSHNLAIYQRNGMTLTNKNYLGKGNKSTFLCPKCLEYQFTPEFILKVSDKCCEKLKKQVAKQWESANAKSICITGMRMAEGGLRNYQSNCTVFNSNDLKKFHPLKPCSNNFVEWLIQIKRTQLCPLYLPPFNFKRTGCLGCPFNTDLKAELNKLCDFAPSQAKAAYSIWRPVYDEYARISYRLDNELLNRIKNL